MVKVYDFFLIVLKDIRFDLEARSKYFEKKACAYH